MRYFFTFIFLFFICLSFVQGQQTNASAYSIGETVEVQSKVLAELRTVNVYLPEGYSEDENGEYNVIYLLDGSHDEDFLHIVGLVQFFELQFKLPPTIVVGIANVDRKRDFTLKTEDQELIDYCPVCGHSEPFIKFLKDELQPFIENRYKVSKRKILIGQSLGGLLASEILLKAPEMFSDYMIVSPSLWWDNESLIEDAPVLLGKMKQKPQHVFVAVGKEGAVMERDAKNLFKALEKADIEGTRLDFLFMKNEDHATILHNAIYQGLLLLFPPERKEED